MLTNKKVHFINNQWIEGNGNPFESISPVTETVCWNGKNATDVECNNAVSSAKEAFYSWSNLTISERTDYIQNFVEVLKKNQVTLAKCIALETGKPQWESLTEVAGMIGKLGPTLAAFEKRNSNFQKEIPNGISNTRFKPHGVITVIGPYNFPGHMPNGHIIPALLAGNTVIFKPSENGAAVAQLTIEYWEEAGLPKGVLNLIQGDGSVGNILCCHKDINGVFFTGSYKVGQLIHNSCGTNKICALEMGGNSPLIVWDSSNIDATVIATIQSAFITTGQRCSSARRLIIPSNAFGQSFIERLIEVTKEIRIGKNDQQQEPYMGPLRTSSLVDSILKKQDELIEKGAVVLLKSERLQTLGSCFVSPGIIDISSITIDYNDNEIIGPFLQVMRVSNFETAIQEANNSDYGLAAGLFSEDYELYKKFEQKIKAGIINWNQQLTGASGWAPFGGIKKSGNFRPSGFLASDYCVYSTGSIEKKNIEMPSKLPSGLLI